MTRGTNMTVQVGENYIPKGTENVDLTSYKVTAVGVNVASLTNCASLREVALLKGEEQWFLERWTLVEA